MLKFLWSSYIVWNTVFIITVLCWFCPVMSVDNWQDENMPANIVNSRISNSAVKRHGNSVFIPTDINMWHFALLHSLIFFCLFWSYSLPPFQHLLGDFVHKFNPCWAPETLSVEYLCIWILSDLLWTHSWEHNCKCVPIVLISKNNLHCESRLPLGLPTFSVLVKYLGISGLFEEQIFTTPSHFLFQLLVFLVCI